MKIPVEDERGHFVLAEFDPAFLNQISNGPAFAQSLADAFRLACQMPDVWRYTVQVKGGKIEPLVEVTEQLIPSNFPDRLATDAAGTKSILLLMESPHTDEYSVDANGKLHPRAPAQGTAGRGVKKYADIVFAQLKLPDGDYSLILANPVPYHASLSLLYQVSPGLRRSRLNRPVRDHVWRVLWKLDFMKKYFLERYRRYSPHTVLNCCTKNLRGEVTDYLFDNGIEASLFETEHPAVRWNALHKKGIPVYRVSGQGRIRTRC